MTAFDRVKNLCNENGIKISELERILGIGKNASYKWKKYSPASDTLFKLSEYFGVSTDYILTGEENGIFKDEYYFDEEANTIAQEIANRPGMKTLLEASRKLPDTDLQYVNDLVRRLGNKK
jgi:transcriptional regulator with XRE-family HTH domain|nr:MAG TPA: repressor protein [Caudoviricetes sp.]